MGCWLKNQFFCVCVQRHVQTHAKSRPGFLLNQKVGTSSVFPLQPLNREATESSRLSPFIRRSVTDSESESEGRTVERLRQEGTDGWQVGRRETSDREEASSESNWNLPLTNHLPRWSCSSMNCGEGQVFHNTHTEHGEDATCFHQTAFSADS